MKKADRPINEDDLREEYDLPNLKGGVRGKYAKSYKEGSNFVVLAPDVAEAFPTSEAANEALRMLISVAKKSKKAS